MYKMKNREVVLYLLFGFLTTVLNVIVFAGCVRLLNFGILVSNVFAWIISVLFAYLTNRRFVFDSRASSAIDIIKECLVFFAGRIGTGIFDIIAVYIVVEILLFNDIITKIVVNFLVVVFNYLISKFLVFKRENKDK